MARQRFTPAERAAYSIGTTVEWRNGGHWHLGRVTLSHFVDDIGVQRVGVIHTGRNTATVGKGHLIYCTPTTIRSLA